MTPNGVQGMIARKLLMRNEYQDDIGERKRQGDTKRTGNCSVPI